MKKINITGMIAAMTIAAATMAVPAMAQTQITEAQALEIALKHAGVAKADASLIQVKPDVDDGMEQFDVEFHAGGKEYNYDIDAKTGRVVDYEADIDD